jgi:hypothetical protein
MDNLLNELSNVNYSAKVIAEHRAQQADDWLKSRRGVGEDSRSSKRRRFNRRADVSFDVAHSEQEATANTGSHSASVETGQSDMQSNTS